MHQLVPTVQAVSKADYTTAGATTAFVIEGCRQDCSCHLYCSETAAGANTAAVTEVAAATAGATTAAAVEAADATASANTAAVTKSADPTAGAITAAVNKGHRHDSRCHRRCCETLKRVLTQLQRPRPPTQQHGSLQQR